MKIIVVDDERLALKKMISLLSKVVPDANVQAFLRASEAVAYCKDHVVDIAFLDIEMPEILGTELAKQCLAFLPKMNIIFVTAYSTYSFDAIQLRVSGYLLKPVNEQSLREELEQLRYHVRSTKKLRVQTFGNFEVFDDLTPLKFSRSKAKEILAYLIDRKGACVSNAELAAVLWEDGYYDRSRQVQIQLFIRELQRVLNDHYFTDVVCKSRNAICIDINKVDCDYFNFLKGELLLPRSYFGEYMNQYSWAEDTAGWLDKAIEVKS